MVYEEIIQALNKDRVDYLVAGGVAVVLHGIIRMTADLDLVVDLDAGNLKKFLSTIKALGYKPRVPVSEKDILDPKKRRQWVEEKNMLALSFYNPKNPLLLVDVLIDQEGLPMDFAAMKQGSVKYKIGRLSIPVVSVDDMIVLKKAAGREQDKADIKALMEIKKREKNQA